MTRLAAAALLCSLALRWSSAVITEFRPIFPPHYYTDAVEFDKNARKTADNWRQGNRFVPATSPSSKLYTVSVGLIYWMFGAHPIIPKLLNGLIGTAAIYFWYRIALLIIPEGAATFFIWMLALWPSHIFFTSQNLKDPHLSLLSAAAAFVFLRCLKETAGEADPQRPIDHRHALIGAVLMFLTGLFRPYLMLVLTASLVAAAVVAAGRTRRGWKPLAVILLWICAPTLLYRPGMSFIFDNVLTQERYEKTDPDSRISLFPMTRSPDYPEKEIYPLSPEMITKFRKTRHWGDRDWAKRFYNREIGTQIFPDAEFHRWLDVATYLPKGMLYALYMPLPGLYPMEGKLGRRLAALENLALLTLSAAALLFWIKLRPKDIVSTALIVFFCMMAVGYGIFEFDLGAAARHRPQYFPCLFLFAAAFLRESLARKSAFWKT